MSDTCTIALSTTTIRTSDLDGASVVEVTGEVDLVSGGSLLAVLTAQLERGPAGLVVDMTRTDFFCSAGIRVLLDAAAQARDRGLVMVVVADHRVVLRPLLITGAHEELLIQPTVDLALSALPVVRPPALP